jgi:hypothetical protein
MYSRETCQRVASQGGGNDINPCTPGRPAREWHLRCVCGGGGHLKLLTLVELACTLVAKVTDCTPTTGKGRRTFFTPALLASSSSSATCDPHAHETLPIHAHWAPCGDSIHLGRIHQKGKTAVCPSGRITKRQGDPPHGWGRRTVGAWWWKGRHVKHSVGSRHSHNTPVGNSA